MPEKSQTLQEFDYITFGNNIRVLRIGSQIKRSTFAQEFRISVDDLIAYEFAFKAIPLSLAAAMARRFSYSNLLDLTKSWYSNYQITEVADELLPSPSEQINYAEKCEALEMKLNDAIVKCKYLQLSLNQANETIVKLTNKLIDKTE